MGFQTIGTNRNSKYDLVHETARKQEGKWQQVVKNQIVQQGQKVTGAGQQGAPGSFRGWFKHFLFSEVVPDH